MCFGLGPRFSSNYSTCQTLVRYWVRRCSSGITTGGIAAIIMILYLELTNPRRMRFQSQLAALPDLKQFVEPSSLATGVGIPMKDG